MDNNDNNKISVVINTYNAQLYLQQVLDTVKDFDEVLVCDMESTDSTVEIALRNGCKVVTFPKANHRCAEPARTFAIQSASNPWVLTVDADELVTPQLREYLYDRIKDQDCPAGLYIPRKNYFMGRFIRAGYPDYILRFFKREGTVWPPYVHTMPIVQGRTEKIPAGREELALIHLDEEGVESRVRKLNDYSSDAAQKRKGKNYGVLTLFTKPAFHFFKYYIFKGGFRDGKPALIRALLNAFYQVMVVAKVIELNQKSKNNKQI